MLLIAMLVGCGPSWEDFRTAYAEELCAAYEACSGEADPTCVETYAAAVADLEPPASYTPAVGADCLGAVSAFGESCTDEDPDDLCGFALYGN